MVEEIYEGAEWYEGDPVVQLRGDQRVVSVDSRVARSAGRGLIIRASGAGEAIEALYIGLLFDSSDDARRTGRDIVERLVEAMGGDLLKSLQPSQHGEDTTFSKQMRAELREMYGLFDEA